MKHALLFGGPLDGQAVTVADDALVFDIVSLPAAPQPCKCWIDANGRLMDHLPAKVTYVELSPGEFYFVSPSID